MYEHSKFISILDSLPALMGKPEKVNYRNA